MDIKKRSLAFLLLAFAVSLFAGSDFKPVSLGGVYSEHIQGIAVAGGKIYWSQTNCVVRTDNLGKIERIVCTPGHTGDCCFHDGKLYVAVNRGQFNTKDGAKNFVWVFDADLNFLASHKIDFPAGGCGAIEYYNGSFYITGGVHPSLPTFKIYKCSPEFKQEKVFEIPVSDTMFGVQTILRAHGRFWLGCYLYSGGSSRLPTLECDDNFNVIKRHKLDTACGMAAIENSNGDNILVARGAMKKNAAFDEWTSYAAPARIVPTKKD